MKTYMIRLTLLITSLFLALSAYTSVQPETPNATAASTAGEMRCGWFANPTPANASLYDRDAEWIIGVQGGHQADGDWPEFGPGQWVKTNGNYGYGCACLRVEANSRTHEVSRIESAEPRALSACRKDAALKRWGFK
jgi:hypothetical protein